MRVESREQYIARMVTYVERGLVFNHASLEIAKEVFDAAWAAGLDPLLLEGARTISEGRHGVTLRDRPVGNLWRVSCYGNSRAST